ncbi:MAG TPA: replication-associated recombination protein A [Polyangiaceae bacterium]|nr:replication-associated recombination protein A [Polyangiaceae bacterium]
MAARSKSSGRDAAGPSLFEAQRSTDPMARATVPLAERMRPRRLADLAGQATLVGDGTPLERAIASDRVRSMILWGPPGSGKTTLARVIADSTQATFVALNAVLAGVADVREATSTAREARRYQGKRTILFIDEIHRFNKAQQDALLPQVEDGTITLIGATTENPSFSVNAPLLSRCKVYRLRALDETALAALLERALVDERGLAGAVRAEPEALRAIARLAQGDARRALTSLELAADEVAGRGDDTVTLADIGAQAEHKTLLYDKAGEEHYNVVSAFIKSMRGSDPDAAIYWAMRMLEAGDDPLFVTRRMIIFASEDVGNADPQAIQVAVAADASFRRLGMPEGLFPIAQCCTYLASTVKSNASYAAFTAAREDVKEHGALEIPLHLRNAPTKLMKELNYARNYRYAHDEPEGVADMQCLPPAHADRKFYKPTERGFEAEIRKRIEEWKRKRRP